MTIRNGRTSSSGKLQMTPAMQAGIIDRLWKIDELFDNVKGLNQDGIAYERYNASAEAAVRQWAMGFGCGRVARWREVQAMLRAFRISLAGLCLIVVAASIAPAFMLDGPDRMKHYGAFLAVTVS